MRAPWILGCSVVLALAAVPAFAQPVVAAKSGTISVADGKVFLDANLLDIQPGQFPDMKEKSVLRTEEGRAEVLLPPGMFLRVGENASFRMVSNRLVDTRLELLSGSGVVEIDSSNKDTAVTMVLKDGTVTFTKGVYRFDSDPPRVKVFDGSAAVEIAGQSQTVPTGKMIGLASDSASVERFDIRDTDSLDHWSRRRGEELAMANVSAAKRAQGNTWSSSINPCVGTGIGGYGTGGYGGIGRSYALGSPDSGVWAYNPWYGMYTYMPCNGMFMSPYGYGFYSPYAIGRMYYNPGTFFGRGGGLASGGGVAARGLTNGGAPAPTRSGVGFGSAGSVSHGYSGVVAASNAGGGSSGGSGAAAGGGAGRTSGGGIGAGGGGGGMSGGGFGGGARGGGGAAGGGARGR